MTLWMTFMISCIQAFLLCWCLCVSQYHGVARSYYQFYCRILEVFKCWKNNSFESTLIVSSFFFIFKQHARKVGPQVLPALFTTLPLIGVEAEIVDCILQLLHPWVPSTGLYGFQRGYWRSCTSFRLCSGLALIEGSLNQVLVSSVDIQPNFNSSNDFGTMKRCSS